MKMKCFYGLLAAATISAILFTLRPTSKVQAPAASAAPVTTVAVAPVVGQTTPAASLATTAKPAPAGIPLLPPQDQLWEQPVSETPFANFTEWTRRYAQATTPETKAALEAEGVALAETRRAALADLIQSNPERALELAVPFAVRRAMPASVLALLEERVNARGDYQVLGVMPVAGAAHSLPPVIRSAQIGGEQYQVFTYGSGLAHVTKSGVPMNGLALPAPDALPGRTLTDAKKILALGPAARWLERVELEALQAARPANPMCFTSDHPVSSQSAETAVELGGNIYPFCCKGHGEDWANAGIAAAGLTTPSGWLSGADTAESSYTEGRKRMLCLRPYWSDRAVAMSTNTGLTHFQNFSNYMFQMSYGKLVFAPLGRGSDISTEILLPGSVADYTSGLGTIFTTVKEVARTNYGYDISQYDFIYYVTGSQPAASYAGLGFVGGVGFHLANGYFDAAVSSHEFGHNLGLNHANFWDTASQSIIGNGANNEYGDSNDPMGGGGSPNDYNSRYKNYLGWIKDTDIADLNATGSGLYRLHAFDLNQGVGLRGLKFRRNSSQNYWLNFRQRKTDKKALMNGVQLMWTGNGNESSHVLDVRLKGNSDNNAIAIGRTFTDASLGFHATPVGKGHTFPESLDVRINVGTFPANQPPVTTVSASPANPGPAETVTFSAVATDPNGDALAYYYDFGDGDYSIDNSASTTHAFAAAGEYAVQCTVSDMKGGTARRTVIVRVGDPATFRIGGRVLDGQNRPLGGIYVSSDTGRSAFTDSDGTYTLVGLAAGGHNLAAREPVAGAFSFTHPFFSNPVAVGPNQVDMDFIIGTSAPPVTLVAAGSTWKYLDNGTDQGTAWSAPAFNDAAWASGAAQLGYGEGDEATVVSFGPSASAKYTTTYFRRAFTAASPSVYSNLTVSLLRDDGGVVYLNGVEIFRSNMPAGALTSATFASDSVDDQVFFSTAVSPALLATGNNVLAVEIHQSDLTSSDVSFDLSLTAQFITNAVVGTAVYLTSPANNATIATPTNLTLTANALTASGTFTNVEFFDGATKLGADADAPFAFTWINPGPGLHTLRVVATHETLRVTSAPVVITITAPIAPPLALTLIAPGAIWNYLAGPTSAPPTWTALNFNDSSWVPGPAQLGYGDGDEATLLPFGGVADNKWNTTYFRRAFLVEDPGAVTNLSVRLLRDDGGIVYLNGVEVFRSNITNAPVTYATLAFSAADETSFFSTSVNPALLQPGTNVIAVEIHQSSANSSDLSFDLALDAVASTNRPRGLWLTAPTNGATVPLPGSVTLVAQAVAGGSLGVARVEFFANGVKLGETNAAPYQFVWNQPPGGAHTLTAVATDTAGATLVSAPVSITVSAPPLGTALVSFGDVWKYLDDGSNPGTAWAGRLFNDNSWMAGPSKLGYGGDGELTTVSFGTNASTKHITTYFRRAFTVANPAVYSGLLLRLIRDDGAAVFLNGVEVYRTNLQAGLLSWNSTALADVAGTAETTPLDVTLPTTGLLVGTNVLAVEIHQSTLTSSDLGFNLALLGLNATNFVEGIYLTSPAQGTRFNLPASISLAAHAAAPAPITLVEYFDGSTKVGQATARPFAATWNGAAVGTHTLTARATYGAGLQSTSAPITIVVGTAPPPIVPVFEALVVPGASWKYWDNAAGVGPEWATRSFDDAAWPAANARFGWGLDGEMSPLTEGRVTHYFRRWFTSANPALLSGLFFELVRDDGAVVYLNGVEVFRHNLPAGPVAASTLALTSVNTPEETMWFENIIAATGSGLMSGSNLVAIELHQSSGSSSDGSFDFALFGEGTTERRAYLSAPVQGASYAGTATITLEALAHPGAGLGVTKIEFFADGTKLGESTAAPYRFHWFGGAFGPHTLTARLTDSAGGTLDTAPVVITLTRELVSTLLIPSNSVWKYLDTGSNQGTNWSQRTFNDAAWASGPARLGFGGDGEATVVNGGPGTARYPTIYFRRAITVPPGVIYTNLAFKLARDDGAVVHLNGREVFRSNIAAGTVTYATLAATATDEQTFFPTTVVVTNLPAGTNIIAVEVHQSAANSSDLGFNLELVASGYLEDTAPPELSVTLEEGVVELSWSGLSAGWQVSSAGSVDAPAAAWTPVAGTPVLAGGRYVLSILPTEEQQFFRLIRP